MNEDELVYDEPESLVDVPSPEYPDLEPPPEPEVEEESEEVSFDEDSFKALVGSAVEQVTNKQADRYEQLINTLKPEQSERQEELPYDPNNHFVVEGGDQAEQSRVLTERVNALIDYKMSQVQDQVNQLGGASYLMSKLQQDPGLADIQSDVLDLVNTGRADFDTAVELVRLRSTPKPKPVPPASASSPRAKAAPAPQSPRQRGIPNVRDLMRGDPEIQRILSNMGR